MATKVAEAYVSIRANTATLMADLNTAKGATVANANQMGMAFPKGIAPGVASANRVITTIPKTTAVAAAKVKAQTAGMSGSFMGFAKSMAGAFGVMAGMGAFAVGAKKAIEFDEAMIEATTAMQVSGEAADELSDKARNVGVAWGVGATKAGEALGYLGLAGFNAEESMMGLEEVIKLGIAGNMDAAVASDILTDSLSALGFGALEGAAKIEKMVEIGDQLAKGSITANTSVEQLGEAILNKAGTSAANAGMKIADLNAMLLILADKGKKGAVAGTLAATAIDGLGKAAAKDPTGDLNEAMFDAQGNMRPLEDIIRRLTKVYGDLSPEARMAKMEQDGINRQAVTAVNMFLGMGDAAEEYKNKLEGAGGEMDRMANRKMQSLSNQIKRLKAMLEDLSISVIGPLVGALIDLFAPIAKIAMAIGRWSEANHNLIPMLVKSIGAAVALKVLIPLVAQGVMWLSKALIGLALSNPFTFLLTAVIMFIQYVRAAAAAGEEWAKPFIDAGKEIWEKLTEIGAKVMEVAKQAMTQLAPAWQMVKDVVMNVINGLIALITQFIDHMNTEVEDGRNSWDIAFEVMRNVVEGVIKAAIAIFNVMKQVFDTVVMAMAKAWDFVFGTAFSEGTDGAFAVFLDWVTSILDWLSLMTTNWGLTWELIKNHTAIWILKARNVVMTVFELWKIGALAWLGTWIGVFKGIYNWTKYLMTAAFVVVKANFMGMIAMAQEAWKKITLRGSGKSLGTHYKNEFLRAMDEEMPDAPDSMGDTIRQEIKNWAGGAVQEHVENKAEREGEVQTLKDRNEEIKEQMRKEREEKRKAEDKAAEGLKEEDKEEVAEDIGEEVKDKVKEKVSEKGLLDIGFKGIQEFGRSIQDALLDDKNTKRDDKQAKDINGIKALQEQNNSIQMAQLQAMQNTNNDGGGLAAPN